MSTKQSLNANSRKKGNARRDRHGETLDPVYTYIEWLSDALHETYCHENLDHTREPIETMQDEMEDKAPALLEELDEQNRMISDLRESLECLTLAVQRTKREDEFSARQPGKTDI
jgi:hypothetical protein